MAISLALLIVTVLLHEILPHAVYEAVHPFIGTVFLLLAAVHIFLNWGWIKANYLKKNNN